MDKEDKIDVGGFDADADLDFDYSGLDDTYEDVPDDRSPVTKLVGAAVSGAADKAMSAGFITKFVKSAMPKEFGSTFDTLDKASDSLSSLYDSSIKAARPAISSIKRTADKVLDLGKDKLPESVYDRLKAVTKEERGYTPQSDEEYQEQGIEAALASVFSAQIDAQEHFRKVDSEREFRTGILDQEMETNRHEGTIKLLGGIYRNSGQLLAYGTSIDLNYKKKSLELQLRQLNTQQGLLRAFSEYWEFIKPATEGILKNTGLPEFSKTTTAEALSDQLREGFISDVESTVFGRRKEFMGRVFKNLQKRVVSKVKDVSMAAELGLGFLDMPISILESGGGESRLGMGLELAGESIGKWLIDELGDNAASLIREQLDKLPSIDAKAEYIKVIIEARRAATEDDQGDLPPAESRERRRKAALGRVLGGVSTGDADAAAWTDERILSAREGLADAAGKLKTAGHWAQYGVENLPQILSGLLNSREPNTVKDAFSKSVLLTADQLNQGESNGRIRTALSGVLGGVGSVVDSGLDMLRESVNEELTTVGMTKRRSGMELMGAGSTTRHTINTIEQVIPGYLARIYRELQVIRTGDDGIELTEVDPDTGKFVDSSTLAKTVLGALLPKSRVEATMAEGDRVLGLIDPDKKLPEEYRTQLVSRMLESNRKSVIGSLSNMAELESPEYSGVFKRYFGDTPDPTKMTEFTRAYNQLGASGGSLTNSIQRYRNVGLDSTLERLGLLGENGEINLTEVDRILAGGAARGLDGRAIGAASSAGLNPAPATSRSNTDVASAINRIGEVIRQSISDVRAESRMHGPGGATAGHAAHGKATTNETDAVVEELRSGRLLKTSEKIREILTGIDYRLSMLPAAMAAASAPGGDLGQGSGDRQTLFGSAGDFLGRGLRGVGGLAAAMGRGTASVLSSPFRALSSATGKSLLGRLGATALGVAGGVLGSVQNAFTKAMDITVDGEKTPRVYAEKMSRGDYFDSVTNKPVTTLNALKKLRGDLIEFVGGVPRVVITREELESSKVFRRGWEPLTKVLGGAKWFATTTGNLYIKGAIGAFKLMASTARNSLSLYKRIEKLKGQRDVYVKGRPERPVLYATLFKSGGYRSRATGKIVTRINEIDGPVLDLSGNEVLTDDDIRTGLVDVEGNPIAERASYRMALLKKTIGLATKIGRGTVDLIAGGFKMAGGLLSKLGNWSGLVIGGVGETNKILNKIHDLLVERLPGGDVRGDSDDDGIRDGSIEDLRRRRKPKATLKGLMSSAKAKAAGVWGGITDKASDAVDSAKEWLTGEAADELGDALDTDGRRKRGARPTTAPGKPGMASRAWQRAKLLGNSTVARASLAGATAKGAVAAKGTALAAGTKGALLAAGATLSAGAAAAAGVATKAAVGLAGVLSAPVTLGALALGGAAYLGYRAIKRRLGQLSQVRYVQYGFNVDDRDHVARVMGLEAALESAVVGSTGGPRIDPSKLDLPKLQEDFGVDIASPEEVARFDKWVEVRFKPVFLTNLAALRAVKASGKLDDADGLSPTEKLEVLRKSKIQSGAPYEYRVGPVTDIQTLPSGQAEVKAITDRVEAQLVKETEGSAARAKAASAITVAGAAAGAGAITLVPSATPAASIARAVSVAPSDSEGSASWLDTVKQPLVGVSSVFLPGKKGGGTALEAIRFKTYGLVTLEPDKVGSLMALEDYASGMVKIDGKGVATLSDKTSGPNLLKRVVTVFGGDPEATRVWLMDRFIKVYLNYRSALYQETKTRDTGVEARLTPRGQLAVAEGIRQAPVWRVTASPWVGYELLTDPNALTPNLDAIKKSVRERPNEEAAYHKTAEDRRREREEAITAWGERNGVVGKLAAKVASGVMGAAGAAKDTVMRVGAGAIATGQQAVDAVSNAAQSYSQTRAEGGNVLDSIKQAITGPKIEIPKGPVEDRPAYRGLLAEMQARNYTPAMQAAVMASIQAESNFVPQSEGMTYRSVDRLREVFRDRMAGLPPAALAGFVNNPEALADHVYGGRMGNTAPGDGYRYRGRGIVQLTGKGNYAAASRELFGDDRLVTNPDLANDPSTSVKLALRHVEQNAPGRAKRDYGKSLQELTPEQAGSAVAMAIMGPGVKVERLSPHHKESLAKRIGMTLGYVDKLKSTGPAAVSASPVPTAATPTAAAIAPVAAAASGGTVPKTPGPAAASSGATPAVAMGKAVAPPALAPVATTASGVKAMPPAQGKVAANAVVNPPPPPPPPMAGAVGAAPVTAATRASAAAMSQQAAAQSDESIKILGGIDSVLRSSLKVQTGQLGVLESILRALSSSKTPPAISAPTPAVPAARVSQRAPEPPIATTR